MPIHQNLIAVTNLVRVFLLGVVLVVLGSHAALPVYPPENGAALWAVAAVALLPALGAILLRRHPAAGGRIANQVLLGLDLVVISAFSFLSGYPPFIILYLFPLANAALAYGRRGALVVLLAVTLLHVPHLLAPDEPAAVAPLPAGTPAAHGGASVAAGTGGSVAATAAHERASVAAGTGGSVAATAAPAPPPDAGTAGLAHSRDLIVELLLLTVLTLFIGKLGLVLRDEEERARTAEKLVAMNRELERFGEEMNRVVSELGTLHEFSYLLGMSWEREDLLHALVEKLQVIAGVDDILVVLQEEEAGLRVAGASPGLKGLIGSVEWTDDRSSEQWAMMMSEPLLQFELDRIEKLPEPIRGKFASPMVVSLPMMVSSTAIGVVNLYGEADKKIGERLRLQFLLTAVGQATTAIQNLKILGQMKQTYLATIESMALALDAKDPYTNGHSTRVRRYALAAAERYGLAEKERELLDIAATVHDLGKLGIEDKILRKDRHLTPAEFEQIKAHTTNTQRILEPLGFLDKVIPLAVAHHERWDGQGYPRQLAAEAIPRPSRLLGVADSFDAMTSNRTYRAALATKVAIAELRKGSGTQFEPQAVDAFVATLEQDVELRQEIEARYLNWKEMWEADQQAALAAAPSATELSYDN